MTASRSRTGHGWDNACIESWHRLLKKALVHLSHLRTRAEARTALYESIAVVYHQQRLHSAWAYRTPPEEAVIAHRLSHAFPIFHCPRS